MMSDQPSTTYSIRCANADDISKMCELLFDHGVNEWNYLPWEPITAHLRGIADGSTSAVIAEQNGVLLGFVSFVIGYDMANYQPTGRETAPHGIVHEAVVRRESAGQGIGSQLLIESVNNLAARGCHEVYVSRHDENLASAGMMRKAGFAIIDVFDDFVRRTTGNRRTAVSRKIIVEE